jgi:serine phosphatase RsbU (regulator of sigma subunit)
MRDLLPPTLHHVTGADVAARYRPAGENSRVGGDFYDVHPVERSPGATGGGGATESLVVLGDVCGKGLDAAVLAGKIRTTVQALTPFARDHARLLGLLNGSLTNDDHTRFATLVLASLTRVDADVRLRITCAGHPAPMVVRVNGQVEEVASRGTLIGVLSEIRVDTSEVVLAPGDVCLLFTDGITEARGPVGGDQFGEHRLAEVLAECAGTPAEAVVERVMMLVDRWIGDAEHDDIALLAIGAPRGRHLTAVGGHGRGRYTA